MHMMKQLNNVALLYYATAVGRTYLEITGVVLFGFLQTPQFINVITHRSDIVKMATVAVPLLTTPGTQIMHHHA
jgi:hypothetical protein